MEHVVLALMKQQQMSLRTLALLSGISPSTLSLRLRGVVEFKPSELRRIAAVFGLTVDIIWRQAGEQETALGQKQHHVALEEVSL